MNNFVICTDSSCDLDIQQLNSRKLPCLFLSYHFEGTKTEQTNNNLSTKTFYSKMRQGFIAKTAAVNPDCFIKEFNSIVSDGKDVLYIGFSSALSTTFNSARIAAMQLKDLFPERKIITVDTLSASAGIAMLLDLAIEKRHSGASIEETAQYIENIKLNIHHWFTVDDLIYLKRGGRISPTTAFVGNMLGIKPILKVNSDGQLVNSSKVRGRANSIITLAQKYNEFHDNKYNEVYISHGDCINDATTLSKLLYEKYGAKTALITDVGAVIGAHSGPGTLALFFVGTER